MAYVFDDPESSNDIKAENEDELVQKAQRHMQQEHNKDVPENYVRDNIEER